METPEERSDGPAMVIVALLIAFTSVIGAIVAWRGSIAADAAGDADTAGLRATINLNETRALSSVTAYGDYGAYTQYYRERQLTQTLEEDLAELPEDAEDEIEVLVEELSRTTDNATAAQGTFPNQYLNRDGTYALDRQLGQLFADSARLRDLDPAANFLEADRFRVKSEQFLITFSILAVALVAFTLIEVVGQRAKYLLLIAGSLLLVAGTVGAVLVEMGRLS